MPDAPTDRDKAFAAYAADGTKAWAEQRAFAAGYDQAVADITRAGGALARAYEIMEGGDPE